MKKITIFMFLMMFLATACGDSDSALNENADPNAALGSMVEISVESLEERGESELLRTITVDASRSIVIDYVATAASSKAVGECTGMAELSEDDYVSLETAVIAADMLNYEMPIANSCDPSAIGLGFSILYKDVSGEEVEVHTGNCEPDVAIDNVFLMLDGLAEQYISDCDELPDVGGEEEVVEDPGTAEESDVVVYEVPIINPSKLPVPRRVIY